MIPPNEILATIYVTRHCTEYGCRKCIARARWNRRKKRHTRKRAARHTHGRK
jgi:hypothetical protein